METAPKRRGVVLTPTYSSFQIRSSASRSSMNFSTENKPSSGSLIRSKASRSYSFLFGGVIRAPSCDQGGEPRVREREGCNGEGGALPPRQPGQRVAGGGREKRGAFK